MCGCMVDIQSEMAEIRRGKEKKEKKIEQTTGQKYNVCICYAGRPYLVLYAIFSEIMDYKCLT